MKTIKIIALLQICFISSPIFGETPTSSHPLGYNYTGTELKLSNLQVYPADLLDTNNDINKMTDGKCIDKYSYGFPWSKEKHEPITIIADIDGIGKRLDQVVIEQRYISYRGLINEAEIWVMTKGSYQKIAHTKLNNINERMFFSLIEPIFNPSKIKVIIKGSEDFDSIRSDKIFLGDLVCLTLNDPVKIILERFSDLFEDKSGATMKKAILKNDIRSIQVPILVEVATDYLRWNNQFDRTGLSNPTNFIVIDNSQINFDTNVFLEPGEHVVFLGRTSREVYLELFNSITNEEFNYTKLNVGANLIRADKRGLVKIKTDKSNSEVPLILNFPSGFIVAR